jgi:hypothetical protein
VLKIKDFLGVEPCRLLQSGLKVNGQLQLLQGLNQIQPTFDAVGNISQIDFLTLKENDLIAYSWIGIEV